MSSHSLYDGFLFPASLTSFFVMLLSKPDGSYERARLSMTPIRHHAHISHSQHFIPKTAIHHSASILRPQIDKTAAFLCKILSVNKQFMDIWSRGIFAKTSVGSRAFSFYWLISSTSNKPLVIWKRSYISGIPQPGAYVPTILCCQKLAPWSSKAL